MKKSFFILKVSFTKKNIFFNFISNRFLIFGFSSGNLGYKGSKKISTTAVSDLINHFLKKIELLQIKAFKLKLRGLVRNHAFFLREFTKANLLVEQITVLPKIVFNGCRSKKK